MLRGLSFDGFCSSLRFRFPVQIWIPILSFLIACGPLIAQMTVTGTITGQVADPSAAAVSGANITLVRNRTRERRTAVPSAGGSFRVLAVSPEAYTVRVEDAGVKNYERTEVRLTANERLD